MIEISKAVDLWNAGLTMTQIGKNLGLTKGQVAGTISRNRELFSRRIDPIKRLEAEIADTLFESIKEDERPNTANALRKLFSEASEPEPMITKAMAAEYDASRLPGYTLWDLDAKGCKWAISDGPIKFCGERRYQMKPWCSHHNRRAWRAP